LRGGIALAALMLPAALPGPALGQDVAAAYRSKCAGCHGADGKKNGDLTALKDVAKTEAAIANGVPEKKMPGYRGKLSDAEIQALAKYLTSGGLKELRTCS